MNIQSTVRAPRSVTREQLNSEVKARMATPDPESAATQKSGQELLDSVATAQGSDIASIRQDLSQRAETARSREKIASWVSNGANTVFAVGVAAQVLTRSFVPAVFALPVVGVGAAVAQGYFAGQAGQSESAVQNLDNWAGFIQNKDQVPARPALAVPIGEEEFVSAAQTLAQAPHPQGEVVRSSVGRLTELFDEHDSSDTESLKKTLSEARDDARTDKHYSYGQIAVGLGLTVGALVAGVGGHIAPLATLGGTLSGLVIAHTGTTSVEEFRQAEQQADSDLSALQRYTQYMSGQ